MCGIRLKLHILAEPIEEVSKLQTMCMNPANLYTLGAKYSPQRVICKATIKFICLMFPVVIPKNFLLPIKFVKLFATLYFSQIVSARVQSGVTGALYPGPI